MFRAAGCVDLRFLITCDHPPKIGAKSESDTYNDGGVYWNHDEAQKATNLTPDESKKNPVAVELPRSYGRTSFHHVVVPLEVKYDSRFTAFNFPPSSKSSAKPIADGTTPKSTVATEEQDSIARGRREVDAEEVPGQRIVNAANAEAQEVDGSEFDIRIILNIC